MNIGITLPRPLVNELLHEAQLADQKPALGLISRRDGAVIAHYPIARDASEDDIRGLLAQLETRGEHVWAIYRSHDCEQHETLTRIVNDDEVLQLVISLDIKGVLQLSGYQHEHPPQEIALTLG